jgi:hypothetical protein
MTNDSLVDEEALDYLFKGVYCLFYGVYELIRFDGEDVLITIGFAVLFVERNYCYLIYSSLCRLTSKIIA